MRWVDTGACNVVFCCPVFLFNSPTSHFLHPLPPFPLSTSLSAHRLPFARHKPSFSSFSFLLPTTILHSFHHKQTLKYSKKRKKKAWVEMLMLEPEPCCEAGPILYTVRGYGITSFCFCLLSSCGAQRSPCTTQPPGTPWSKPSPPCGWRPTRARPSSHHRSYPVLVVEGAP